MTLAPQMYPDNSKHLMRHCKVGMETPFEYLLKNLYQTTPEYLRIPSDVHISIE